MYNCYTRRHLFFSFTQIQIYDFFYIFCKDTCENLFLENFIAEMPFQKFLINLNRNSLQRYSNVKKLKESLRKSIKKDKL